MVDFTISSKWLIVVDLLEFQARINELLKQNDISLLWVNGNLQ